MHIVQWFQVMLQFNINYLYSQMVKQFYLVHTGTTTPDQIGVGSNCNEGVLNIPQISRSRASLSDCLVSHPGHLFGGSDGSVCVCGGSNPSAVWAVYD